MAEVPSLGERGGGWVAIQFALMGAIVLACLAGQRWPEPVSRPLFVAGGVLAIAGAALAFESARALGKSMTPFPRPVEAGQLVQSGPYRVVRHPLYAGGILFFAGFSLAFSPTALALTGVLTAMWGLKVQLEEKLLRAAYPEYAEYAARTRYRLFPFVY